jgi:hypothetical protein
MGVDYSAKFGIGYKIKVANEIVEDEYDGDTYECLDNILEEREGVNFFSTGSEVYGGEPNEYYLIADETFAKGLDLTHIKQFLDEIIDSSALERDSEFGLVGGLKIW